MELGEDTLIEDLPRRFAAMVLDKATGQAVALDSGPLLQAVQASIALPGFARPVQIGSRLYIDGGLKGTIPSSVAYELGAERIVRVELVGSNPIRVGIRRFVEAPVKSVLVRPTQAPVVPSRFSDRPPETVIFPRFYGLFCNSPVGIGFCVRRGQLAAAALIPRDRVGLQPL
jgi:predicted acylesterase/phospholipase RssA